MSLEAAMPNHTAAESMPVVNLIHSDDYRWKSHCHGLFELPKALCQYTQLQNHQFFAKVSPKVSPTTEKSEILENKSI